MLPHQQRVVDEKSDLDTKILALKKFIDGELFGSIRPPEQHMLREQLTHMKNYSYVLEKRIKFFKDLA